MEIPRPEAQISRLRFKSIVHNKRIGKFISRVMMPEDILTDRGGLYIAVSMADGSKVFSENPLPFTHSIDTFASQCGGRLSGKKANNPWENRVWDKSVDEQGAEVYLRSYIF